MKKDGLIPVSNPFLMECVFSIRIIYLLKEWKIERIIYLLKDCKDTGGYAFLNVRYAFLNIDRSKYMHDESPDKHFYHDGTPHGTPLTDVMAFLLACPRRYSPKDNLP